MNAGYDAQIRTTESAGLNPNERLFLSDLRLLHLDSFQSIRA
jgi:hypothetical protein